MRRAGSLGAGRPPGDACTSLARVSDAEEHLLVAGYESGRVAVLDARAGGSGNPPAGADEGREVEDLLCAPGAAQPVVVVAAGERVSMLDLRKASCSAAGCAVRLAAVSTSAAAPAPAGGLPVGEPQRLALHSKGEEVAVAGDSGDIGLLRLRAAAGEMAPGRILRNGHANACSGLAYVCWRPSELVSGGMDNALARWDTGRARVLSSWDTSVRTRCAGAEAVAPSRTRFWLPGAGAGAAAAAGAAEDDHPGAQLFNPPFVHDVAAPPPRAGAGGRGGATRAVAAACGDGSVLVTRLWGQAGPGRGGKRAAAAAAPSAADVIALGREEGGHASSASCVAFLGGGGPRDEAVVSCGNDRRIVLWTGVLAALGAPGSECASASVLHGRKMNRLCVMSDGPRGAQVAVADTSNVVSLYRID